MTLEEFKRTRFVRALSGSVMLALTVIAISSAWAAARLRDSAADDKRGE